MKKNISKPLSLIVICVTLLFGTLTHAFNPQPEPPCNDKKSQTMNQVKRHDSISENRKNTQCRNMKIRAARTNQMLSLKQTHPVSKNAGSKAANLKQNSTISITPLFPINQQYGYTQIHS